MKIRIAESRDATVLLKLRLENAEYHANTVTKSILKANAPIILKNHTQKCMNNENCKIILAVVDKTPIGYIIGFINHQHPIFDLGKEALIDDFYVKPIFQKKGHGKLLYNELVNWFYQNGVERINLNVYQNNLKGNSFWKRRDFAVQSYRMAKNIEI